MAKTNLLSKISSWTKQDGGSTTDITDSLVVLEDGYSCTFHVTDESSYIYTDVKGSQLIGHTLRIQLDTFSSSDNEPWLNLRMYNSDSSSYEEYNFQGSNMTNFVQEYVVPDDFGKFRIRVRHEYASSGCDADIVLTNIAVYDIAAEPDETPEEPDTPAISTTNINFHKILSKNLPSSVDAGVEHIYYTKEDDGSIRQYISDLNGNLLLVSGNSETTKKLATGRSLSISGKVVSTATLFDGSSDISIPITAIDPSGITQSASYRLVTDTQISEWNAKPTQAEMTKALEDMIGAAPGTLDTLEEIAKALGEDPNFAATMTKELAKKLNLTGGTMTGQINSQNIIPTADATYTLGTSSKTYTQVYARSHPIYDNGIYYGNFCVSTVGTTDTTGSSQLILGNNTATGTDGNARGRIVLYGTNAGYTILYPGNNSDSNIDLSLPSSAGTIALTTDNVASATKLQTARTLTIGNSVKTFDGSTNVTWTLDDIGALPLTGGTLSNDLTISSTNGRLNLKNTNSGQFAYVYKTKDGMMAMQNNLDDNNFNRILIYPSGNQNEIVYQEYTNGDSTKWARILHEGNYGSFALPRTGGNITGELTINPAGTSEGGQINLYAGSSGTTYNGISLDQYEGKFRIFGIPSADGTTKTGVGTVLQIDPYAKTITGGYTFTGTASNADTLDNYHGSSSATANTYVLRDSNNYVYFNYINSNTSNSENPTISQIIVTNGSDNYYRKASLEHLKISLGLDGNLQIIANSVPLASGGWKTLGGRTIGSKIAISYCNSGPAAWNSESYSSSIVFGAQDTKGLLDCAYSSPMVTFGGGSVGNSTDDAPAWYFKLAGASTATYTLPSSSATLLSSLGGTVSGATTFNNGIKVGSGANANIAYNTSSGCLEITV